MALAQRDDGHTDPVSLPARHPGTVECRAPDPLNDGRSHPLPPSRKAKP